MTECTDRLDTLLDVYLRLPSLYSSASAQAYRSAFERAERLTGKRLAQIPAEVIEWERLAARIVWAGEFTRAKTPEARQRAFDGFVNRISAAIRRAQEADAPQTVPGDVTADWDAIADYVALAETTFDAQGDRLLPTLSTLSIANLRSRLGHVRPAEIDTVEAIAALRALPAGKTVSFRNAIRFLDGLVATRARHAPITPLLPSTPVGDLPTLRDRPMDWSLCSETFRADLSRVVELAIRGARERDRFGGRLGRDPVAERRRATQGRKRPVRNKTLRAKAFYAALSWLARHAYTDRAQVCTFGRIGDLLTGDNVAAAVDRFAARAKADGVLKDPNTTSSVSTYLTDLGTIAKRTGADEALLWEIEDLRFDFYEECEGLREMSVTREAFVKLVDRDPEVVRAILTGPRVLLKEARRLLARSTLTTHQRTEALHLFIAAAMLAIQLARPLRTRNVHEMLSEGETPELVPPRRDRASAWLDIGRGRVKNRRPLEGRIPDWLWRVISAWIEEGRPLWRARGLDAEAKTETADADAKLPETPAADDASRDEADDASARLCPNDHLFPALSGSGPVSRGLINKAWNRGMARLGLTGLTPHMMRHVDATIYLARHPGDYAVVAALLADKLRTVETFYARGEGRAAMDLFADILTELDPTLDLKGAD